MNGGRAQRLLHGPLLDEHGTDLVVPGSETAHASLFLQYCEGLGLKKDGVVNAIIVPGVVLAVTELRRIAYERPAFEFIACSNLVIESMCPRHYRELLKTFSTHYTWVPQSSLLFYEVHSEVDVGHAPLGRSVVESYVSSSKRDQDAVFSAVLRSLCLRLPMYDGIEAAMKHNGVVGLKPWPNFPREPWPRPKKNGG